MLKKAVTYLLIMVMLVMVIVIGSGCARTAGSEGENDENYVAVETEIATEGEIANQVRLRGQIATNEEVNVIPKTMGIVESINVKLGDKVTKDTVLFTIEQTDILNSLDQAESSLSLASKSVDQAENALRTAQLNYEMTQEQVDNAKLNLERTRRLYEEGAVSITQLEQAELSASEKPLEISKTQVAQAEVSLQQAKEQYRQAEIAHDQAKNSFNNTIVKAPIDGVVSAINVKVGQIATNSQAAAVIVDTSNVYIQLNVVENMVNQLQVGQSVEVNVPAASQDSFNSVIEFISPTVDQRTQLYPVKINISNESGLLRPGMNGEVLLDTASIPKAIVVKSNAVLERDEANIVYVVEDERAVEREVVLGLDTGDYVEIIEGINEGDAVIVSGQHYVEDGQRVKVVRGE
ncbi:efflux RND transporter periplasmic adaptor subunit [Alkaliphilus crotonatoxidans]